MKILSLLLSASLCMSTLFACTSAARQATPNLSSSASTTSTLANSPHPIASSSTQSAGFEIGLLTAEDMRTQQVPSGCSITVRPESSSGSFNYLFYSRLARAADDFALVKINGEVFRLYRADSSNESEKEQISRTYVSQDPEIQVRIDIDIAADTNIGTLQVQYRGETVSITGQSNAGC